MDNGLEFHMESERLNFLDYALVNEVGLKNGDN